MVSVVLPFLHVGVVQAAWERVGCIAGKPAFVQDFFFYAVFWFAALGQTCLFILWEVP